MDRPELFEVICGLAGDGNVTSDSHKTLPFGCSLPVLLESAKPSILQILIQIIQMHNILFFSDSKLLEIYFCP